MPWKTGRSFAVAHNRKLKGAAASKAARVATAMVNRGLPEGEAIATGNKIGDKAMRDPGAGLHAGMAGRIGTGMAPRLGRLVDAAPRVTNSRASKSRSWTGD
jgi:hypothetical protein